MQETELIPANEFCVHYNVEWSFIRTLGQSGIIEITTVEESSFIPVNQLQKLERLVRLHQELEINHEGVEAISYLLDRIVSMQDEISALKNRLRIYEEE